MSSEASGSSTGGSPATAGSPPARGLTLLSVQPVSERGGSDQALLRLARQLGQAGWTVHIAVPSPSPLADEFAGAGAQLHVVPMMRISTSHAARTWLAYAAHWPVTVARLWRLARRTRADVVHSNSLHSWYGWAVARLAGKPHLWHAREIVTQSGAALRLERALARRFARRVFAVSEAVAAQLDPVNVVVVHDEPGPDECRPGRAGHARPGHDLADAVPTVGYVGRIDTWKGVDVFLDSLPSLAGLVPGCAAVVAGGVVEGKQDYAAALQGQAALLGARWLGELGSEAALDLIADLDCFVYPSTGPEPWGLSMVEALACGVPSVSTDAGGPREIAAGLPATAAVLVPPGDAAALADAIASLLPASTSTAARQARPVLRRGAVAPYPDLMRTAVEGGGAA